MIFYTSLTSRFLPKARILGKTLKKHNPEAKLFIVLSDELPSGFDFSDEPFDGILNSSEIVLNCGMSVPFWIYLHDVTELCTAVKGWAALELLERTGEEKIVYLDPDIVVFNSFEPLEKMLNEHDIIITPHRLAPEPRYDCCFYGDSQLYTRGVFNLGFLAVHKTQQGLDFLKWWRKMLEMYCYIDDSIGLFTDQKIVDLAPAFFNKLHICRDEGYNISWWNLTQRTISGTPDDLKVNGKPVYFYHFSNYDSDLHRSVIEQHCNDNKELWALYNWYSELLDENGYQEFKKISCIYNSYDNGEHITAKAREMSRKRSDIIQEFSYSDPYDTQSPKSLYQYFKNYFPEYLEGGIKHPEPLPESNDYLAEYSAVLNSWSYRIGNKLIRLVKVLLFPLRLARKCAGKVKRFLQSLLVKGPDSYWAKRRERLQKDDRTIVPELHILARSDNPRFTIVIPDAEYFGRIYWCLHSIICNNSKSCTYEVLVSGNMHPETALKLEQSFIGLSVKRGETIASLIQQARGRYVFILSENMQMSEGFISAAIKQMETGDVAVLQTAVCLSSGKLLEAGGIITQSGERLSYGHMVNRAMGNVRYNKEIDCAMLYGVVLDKEWLAKTNGFDTQFSELYQMADMSFQLRALGGRTLYVPNVTIFDVRADSEVQELNGYTDDARKFKTKWHDTLQKENIRDVQEVFLGRDCSKNKRTVFVVDDRTPCFDKSAGDRTTFQYLEVLAEMGYNVKDVPNSMERSEPYATMLEQKGVEIVSADGDGDVEWQEFLRNYGRFINVAYINRYYNLTKYIKLLRQYTNAKIVYNCVDLHFLREQREYTVNNDLEGLKRVAELEKAEIEVTDMSDIVFTLSTYEKGILEKRLKRAKVVLNPIFIYKEFPEVDFDFSSREGLIFVGGFAHTPNVDAVEWFCKRIMPTVLKNLPDIKLHVVGSNPPAKVKSLASANVKVHGFLSDENLAKLYNNCRLCVIPLRYGAGIKGKVLEAMYYGLPVVSTSIGIEGIVDIDGYIDSVDDAQEFAKRVIELYPQTSLLESMGKRNQQYIKERLGLESAKKFFAEVF